jgi:hypothetical protein
MAAEGKAGNRVSSNVISNIAVKLFNVKMVYRCCLGVYFFRLTISKQPYLSFSRNNSISEKYSIKTLAICFVVKIPVRNPGLLLTAVKCIRCRVLVPI